MKNNFSMVDISRNILPKSVKEEIKNIQVERSGPFEKNLALRKQLGKKPVSFEQFVGRVITVIAFLGMVTLLVWGYLASNGGY